MRSLALLPFITALAWGQAAAEANRDYQTAEQRKSIAERLEAPARLANLRPEQLVATLGVKPGWTVVDLGTGTGNLLPQLSAAVGDKGRVIAEDIHPDFIARARSRAEAAGVRNAEYILGTETDPKLPSGSADLVIVLDAYHHFDYPDRMLAAIKKSLKPKGRLAIIEYHKKRGAMESGDPDFAIRHVRAAEEQVKQELAAAGYKLLWTREHAPGRQYIVMFELP